MVVICSNEFNDDEKYAEHFEVFDQIVLSSFQKWAFKAIVEKQHILVTAHTGSGKTLPAEFAIQYFVAQGKKVIYTAPIKALSNTKLCDLRRKYPHISFGIVTGDVTDNPDADVLIMTTEILPNTIMNRKLKTKSKDVPLSFEMDIDNELAAVVFDEVHYINDPERGGVWEQAIIMLPPHVQLIMLSATIDKPEAFASWIETQKQIQSTQLEQVPKEVYLASTDHRVVPLTHYLWISAPRSSLKQAKGSKYEQLLIDHMNKPITIKDEHGCFYEEKYHKISEISDYLHSKKLSRAHVLNELIRHLKNENGLPALCFMFSKKQVEISAKEISFSLFEDGCTIPSTIEKECQQILMKKLPNYKEYLLLPEYLELIELFKKGIGIHHAGVLSVFREMIEMLFEQKKLRLLFATETLAVGINFSTTSVIYTSIYKFDGKSQRILAPHEYTQISGRAGRRGIDKVGKVWLCANLFKLDDVTAFRNMLNGKPQTLSSKFKFSFNLGLNLMASNNGFDDFANQSLITCDIQKEVNYYENTIEELSNNVARMRNVVNASNTDVNVLTTYDTKLGLLSMNTNKQKKILLREIKTMEENNPSIKSDYELLKELQEEENKLSNSKRFRSNADGYIENTVQATISLLQHTGFLDDTKNVTEMGMIAGQFQEIHPLVMAQLTIETNYFDKFSVIELAALFSCFSGIQISEEMQLIKPITSSSLLNSTSKRLYTLLEEYYNKELVYNVDSGSCYDCIYDLQQPVIDWCNAKNESDCRTILNDLKTNSNVLLGEFIKALLKINNVACEFERASEIQQRIDLTSKMRDIQKHTLKFIATTQSLYI